MIIYGVVYVKTRPLTILRSISVSPSRAVPSLRKFKPTNGESASDAKVTGVAELTKEISLRLVHASNAFVPMLATDVGIVSVPVRSGHRRNASGPILVNAFAVAKFKLCNLIQEQNAQPPISLTLEGIRNSPVTSMQFLNELLPIIARLLADDKLKL